MAGANYPTCAWCDTEPGNGSLHWRPPNYRQELTLRTIDGQLIWLHLQCEQHYRGKDD
jgi:hypothetical protein